MSGAPIVSSRPMIINPGQRYVDASFRVPDCPLGEFFLVTGVYSAPEILSDNDARDAAHLPRWGISVPIVQRRWNGQHSASLVALSPGAMPAVAMLPPGHYPGPPKIDGTISVRIRLLGTEPASGRYQFNVHLMGVCGVRYEWAPPPKPAGRGRRSVKPAARRTATSGASAAKSRAPRRRKKT